MRPKQDSEAASGTAIRTFLIADIRGYTLFTAENGDEAAAKLASRFATVTRDCVEAHGGRVIELRGDEALVVFDSARQAIRAAVDLQRRFVDETVADPRMPLPVGIGLDAGEAVPVEDGYRGGAINLAARLCALAGPADVLATREVVHLARKVQGVTSIDRGPVALKGLADPVHVIRVRAEGQDGAEDTAFRRALGASAARLTPAVPAVMVPNPYKGLRSFEEADAQDFFGREEFTERLVERLGETRFLAVVGPSGSGKSSVVRAGLLPALRQGALPGSRDWLIAEMLPGAHPLEELEAALLRVAINPPSSLIEQLERDERGLLRAAKRVLPADGRELLLVIDQLEEVFTLAPDEGIRVHFFGSLEAAVTDPHSRLRVVTTLRADFYDRPLLYRGFAELLRSRVETVVPLSTEELERAISGPARRVDVRLEEGLVAQMLADVADEPGGLPLLEYALTELFDRREGPVFTLEAYRAIGGVSGATGRRAEELYAALDDDGKEATRQLFLHLVTVGEGAEDTRRRAPLSELWALEVDPGAMRSAVDAFGRHRLLTFDRDPTTHGPTVEVAHEALLRAWDRLRGWIDGSREDVRMDRRLADAALEWKARSRESSYLLTGSRLDQFESWAASTPLAIGLEEREYLRASVARREEEDAAERSRRERELGLKRRSVRRLRALVAVLAAGLLASGSVTAIAINTNASAQRASRLATARELAGAALSAVPTNRQLAGLLALESIETTNEDGIVVPDAELALRQAFPSATLESLGGFLEVSLTPDLGRVAIVGKTGPTAVWELAVGKPGRRVFTVPTEDQARSKCRADDGEGARLPTCDAVFHAALSPDGSLLATGHGDRIVRVWDLGSGRIRLVVDRYADLPRAGARRGAEPLEGPEVGFSPDGRYLWTRTHGRMALWGVTSGAKIVPVPSPRSSGAPRGLSWHIAFSEDSRFVSIGGFDTEIWDLEAREVVMVVPGFSTVPTSFASRRPLAAMTSCSGVEGSCIPGTTAVVVADLVDGTVSRLADFPAVGQASVRATDLAFSPDGAWIAGATLDRIVRLWHVTTGEHVTLAANLGPVTTLAWSPDSRFLATGGGDEDVRLWRIDSGEVAITIPASAGTVENLVFTEDGTRLAVASDDGTVRLHIIRLTDLTQFVRDRLARDLTDEECRQFLHVETCPG